MKKINDEFNAQRAKLKELYLQKEADCQKLQKQLNESIVSQKEAEEQNRRAHEEIQTLQILVQETCDESSRSFSEYKRLTEENEHLRQQMLELKAAAAVVQQHPVGFWKSEILMVGCFTTHTVFSRIFLRLWDRCSIMLRKLPKNWAVPTVPARRRTSI
jgi:hypothetical protein